MSNGREMPSVCRYALWGSQVWHVHPACALKATTSKGGVAADVDATFLALLQNQSRLQGATCLSRKHATGTDYLGAGVDVFLDGILRARAHGVERITSDIGSPHGAGKAGTRKGIISVANHVVAGP